MGKERLCHFARLAYIVGNIVDEMWEDDRYWYRLVIEEREFHGYFYFKGDFEKLTDHRVQVFPLHPSAIEQAFVVWAFTIFRLACESTFVT